MNFRTKSLDAIIDHFNSDPENGLTSEGVEQNKEQFGLNQFEEEETISLFSKILDQLKDITMIILMFAGVISTYIAITEHPR